MLDTRARKYIQPQIEKLAKQLLRWHCTPNQITVTAGVIGVVAAGFVVLSMPWVAFGLLWLSGLLDVVDGSMARLSQKASPIGTLLDILLDRVVEIAVLLALIHRRPDTAVWVAVVLGAVVLSMTVFLTVAALIENAGEKTFHYQAGLAERTEGFVMLSCCILFGTLQHIFLIIFAAIIAWTAAQRFIQVVRWFKG